MGLKFKDGFWYWDVGYLFTSPAALFANDVGSLLSLSSSPPIADVVCPRSITFTEAGHPSVTITVVEDAGRLDFTVTVDITAGASPMSADLAGLFFDFT